MDDQRLFDAISDLRKEIRADYQQLRDEITGRVNNHAERLRSLENSRSWVMGVGAAIGATAGWFAAKVKGL